MKVKIEGETVETWNEDGLIICPYCGKSTKADEETFDDEPETEAELYCEKCRHTFTASRKIFFTHETFKQDTEGMPIYKDER